MAPSEVTAPVEILEGATAGGSAGKIAGMRSGGQGRSGSQGNWRCRHPPPPIKPGGAAP